MRSPRSIYIETVRTLSNREARYIDMAAQLRVYRRSKKDTPEPAELLPTVYGGRFDLFQGVYLGQPSLIRELSCHAGQVPVITFNVDGVSRVLALGAKGGGKTEAVVIRALLNALEIPNGNHGLVAPTGKRLNILWRKFIDIVRRFGWIQRIRWSDGMIELKNGSTMIFVSAKRQSQDMGSPIAGYDFHSCVEDEQQNMDDESLLEVDARGRVNPDYCVYSTATNERVPEFQQRLQVYRNAPWSRVLRFTAQDNPWYSLRRLDAMRAQWSPEEWRRVMESEDVALTNAVYPQFSVADNVRRRPEIGVDITAQMTRDKFDPNGEGYEYIVGTDFGVLTTVSTVFKVYRDPQGDRIWWAIDEIVGKNETADAHCARVLARYPTSDMRPKFLAIAMPHVNAGAAGQTEVQDFYQAKRRGIRIVKAHHKTISRKHRFSMVNALLCAADKKRRLFISCDEHNRPSCPKAIESFQMLEYGPDGNPNDFHKSERDLTHYTDTFGYAAFPWEKFRGSDEIRLMALDGHRRRGTA